MSDTKGDSESDTLRKRAPGRPKTDRNYCSVKLFVELSCSFKEKLSSLVSKSNLIAPRKQRDSLRVSVIRLVKKLPFLALQRYNYKHATLFKEIYEKTAAKFGKMMDDQAILHQFGTAELMSLCMPEGRIA